MSDISEAPDTSAAPDGWTGGIPDEEWEIYRNVIEKMRTAGVEFALGGAFALATYSGWWRNTKDLDFYIQEKDREQAMALTNDLGLTDYYDELPYDRAWIYRAHRGITIVDFIWAMANQRAKLDERWLRQGPEIGVRGERVRVLPPEEMIWAKLYVMQRPRCDWPDIVNILYGAGHMMDWDHLIGRLGPDLPLLRGVVSLFSWVCPGRAAKVPAWLWKRLGLPEPESGPDFDRERVNLLETRPWFAPMMREQGEHQGAV